MTIEVKMSKVSLINVRKSDTVFMPLGLLYMAAVLEKNGFKVQVIDIFTYDYEEVVLKKIKDFDPKYIGFSVFTPSYSKVKTLKDKLNDLLAKAIFFAGGVHPTILAQESLLDFDMDFIVRGEGELSLLEALKTLEREDSLDNVEGLTYRDSQGVVKNNPDREPVGKLDTIPFPARHLVNVENYFIPPGYIRSYFLDRVVNVVTSRGCPGCCTFCSSHLLSGRKVRRRSVNNIMQELDLLIAQYHIKGIYFSDETFTTDHDWVVNLCDEIKKRRLPWACATRVDFINDDLIRKMKDSGCKQVEFGIESGSEIVLKTIKKNTSSLRIHKVFASLKENKIRSFANLMVGSPNERYEDIIETKKLLHEIKPNFSLISWFTPFPGTEVSDWALEERGIKLKIADYDFDFVTAEQPLANLSAMSMEQLIKARALLQRAVFFRNYLSMFTFHNIKYILCAIIFSFFSPLKLIRAFSLSIKRRNLEHLIYYIFYNYQEVLFKRKRAKITIN
ncbi:MAG: radical SAM protein [Candidatus Omnitrophica bacterium]|nr:radical SAM protein [Candidatus Omnitrophota bacterium]